MEIQELLPRLEGVQKSGKGYVADCPADKSHQACLRVFEGETGKAYLACEKGCARGLLEFILDLSPEDLDDSFVRRERATPPKPRLISKQSLSKQNYLEKALAAREGDQQDLGFCAREFVLCGLPYQRQESLLYERKNGSFSLRIEASSRYGMPYGQDRLILIWLATAFYAAGCPRDNILKIRFVSDILRTFGVSYPTMGGQDFLRLRARLSRVFGATYYVRDTSFGNKAFREEGYRLIRRVSLWFDQKFRPNQYAPGQNEIELSADFANDLRKAVVPIDLQTVRALKQQPAVLDLYIWQAWRSYRLGRQRGIGSPRDPNQEPLRIPVFGPEGQMWQLGTVTKEKKKQKQLLRQWQKQVKEAWPECPNELSVDGELFLIRPAQALWIPATLSFVGIVRPPFPKTSPPEREPDLSLSDDPEEPTPTK